jgi:hypothetical protein
MWLSGPNTLFESLPHLRYYNQFWQQFHFKYLHMKWLSLAAMTLINLETSLSL